MIISFVIDIVGYIYIICVQFNSLDKLISFNRFFILIIVFFFFKFFMHNNECLSKFRERS